MLKHYDCVHCFFIYSYICFVCVCVIPVLQAFLLSSPEAEVVSKECVLISCVASCNVNHFCMLQKGTWLSASIAQINTDCKVHPIHFWSYTMKGSGLREGNVWERNESFLPAFVLSVHWVYTQCSDIWDWQLGVCSVCSEIKQPSPEAARTTD